MAQERKKIVYIAGANRSGTTVLCQALGAVEGFFACGEIQNAFAVSLAGESCSCGQAVGECAFWQDIVDAVPAEEKQSLIRTKNRYSRIRHLPRNYILRNRIVSDPALREYRDQIVSLYNKIFAKADNRIIVDSSHLPFHGALLAGSGEFDVYVLHLIRDPRAVAYSNLRQKRIFGGSRSRQRMPKVGSVRSTLRWGFSNLFSELFLRDLEYRRISYSDFCAEPAALLGDIVARVSGDAERPVPVEESVIRLPEMHIVCGNPIRGKTDKIEIREDTQWQSELSRRRQLAVVLMSFPLMRRYGLI